jgi:hypothetical protein
MAVYGFVFHLCSDADHRLGEIGNVKSNKLDLPAGCRQHVGGPVTEKWLQYF